MIKRRIIIATILSLFVGMISLWFIFLNQPLIHNSPGIVYTVRQGTSFQSVIQDLYLQKIIKHPLFFRLLVIKKNGFHHLKTGEYLFPKNATSETILNQLITGTGLLQHTFTLIEGWSFKQVKEALGREDKLNHMIQSMSDRDIMFQLGSPQMNPEGLFFPDTYYFIRGSSDLKILKRAFNEMQNKLNQAWLTRKQGLPFNNAYSALIAASLVEKEAHFDDERPLIGRVLLNRLNKNMLLQIDPTVIYGMGDRYKGKIYKSNLRENTVYNTYIHKGLPPTPICMPGLASINAVMHPDENDFLFFVSNGEGRHVFSKTLKEHNKAIADTKKRHMSFFNRELIKGYFIRSII